MKTKTIYYVDMDGTIARFYDEMNYLEKMYEKGFFRGLAAFQNVVEAIQDLVKNGEEVHVLTSVIESDYCKSEKDQWLDEYLPCIPKENRHYVGYGISKAHCGIIVDENAILLDDYNKNLEEWRRAGGTAVKLINNVNNLGRIGPLWNGYSIRYDEPHQHIITKLIHYAPNNIHVIKSALLV